MKRSTFLVGDLFGRSVHHGRPYREQKQASWTGRETKNPTRTIVENFFTYKSKFQTQSTDLAKWISDGRLTKFDLPATNTRLHIDLLGTHFKVGGPNGQERTNDGGRIGGDRGKCRNF